MTPLLVVLSGKATMGDDSLDWSNYQPTDVSQYGESASDTVDTAYGIDPASLQNDKSSSYYIDEQSGQLTDVTTGYAVDPDTGYLIDPDTFEELNPQTMQVENTDYAQFESVGNVAITPLTTNKAASGNSVSSSLLSALGALVSGAGKVASAAKTVTSLTPSQTKSIVSASTVPAQPVAAKTENNFVLPAAIVAAALLLSI